MSHTRFRVNPHSKVAWMSRNYLLETGVKLASLAKWLSARLRTKWLWVRFPLQSLKHKRKIICCKSLRNNVISLEYLSSVLVYESKMPLIRKEIFFSVTMKWTYANANWHSQRQPPEVFCKKFRKIYRKTPVQSLFFNKVAPKSLL